MKAAFKSIEDIRAAAGRDREAAGRFAVEVAANLEGLGRQLRAVVHVADKDAISAAADGTGGLPLHGVPLAHKELYMRQGWPCEGGSRTLAGNLADRTAHAISKLDEAGAMDCGRLTSVELGLGTTGHNPHAGTPANPWNPDYICGGSSSGSSAVVSAGIVPASLGSDTGGSVRLPAAACGLVGVKATHGLVGRGGVVTLSPTLDTVGPLTRSVRDAALVLQAIAGQDDADPVSLPATAGGLLESLEDDIGGLRVGWPANHFFEDCEQSVAGRMKEAFDLAGKLGAERADVVMPGIETANELTMLIIAVEGAALHERAILEQHGNFNAQTLARLLPGMFVPARDYHNAIAGRAQTAKRVLSETFDKVDAVLTPVWPYPLPTIARSDPDASPDAAGLILRSGHNTRPVNYLGFPAVNLPVGFDADGLPVSMQLIGAPFSEARLLRLARAFEREFDFWSARPRLRAEE